MVPRSRPGRLHVKTRTEVTLQKLRGGFYTPDLLVDLALERLQANLGLDGPLRILEPSAGDGAFLRGIARSPIGSRLGSITAVELIDREAGQCRRVAAGLNLPADVVTDDFLKWRQNNNASFDAAIGNPPFVRFQFIDDDTKALARTLAPELGLPPKGVSNLWIPVLLGALASLRPGGAFAFVIPAECFTGISAGAVRTWLVRECEGLTFDLFPPASFPGVLQEVVVLSGRRSSKQNVEQQITIVEHDRGIRRWVHRVEANGHTWTRYLLTPQHLDALREAQDLPHVSLLKDIARFEVAAVTGANAYFSVDQQTVEEYDLHVWAVPLLPRLRLAQGLIYSTIDHLQIVHAGAKSALLDFSETRPNPEAHSGAADYIRLGERRGLHRRYKTRIRRPWYRIPLVRDGTLLLSKRAHLYHRVVLNLAGVVTTDTIYRGWLETTMITETDFVAGFHNSMTLLSAEIEGRSFGGGVLELVPSEIGRLVLPVIPGFGSELRRLDKIARSNGHGRIGNASELIEETNALLVKANMGLTSELVETLEDARQVLSRRRLVRSSWSREPR